jgi:hypothetical protein
MDLLLCRQWGLSATLSAEAALRQDFAQELIRHFRLAAGLVDILNSPLVKQLAARRRPLFGLR